MKSITLIATSSFGLEAVIKREIQDLGFRVTQVVDGRVEFDATLADIPRVNLWLRCADRVLVKMAEFDAEDFDQLFDGVKAIAWEEWIPKNGVVQVTGKSVRSTLESVRSNQSISHKALITRLQDTLGITRLPDHGPHFTVQIALMKDVALVTLDTSGEGLHKRGYRVRPGKAPLRENLAAALVLLSFWNKERLLIDPLCGSGTILIEAALIGHNIAPGLKRTFVSETWPVLEAAWWDDARRAAHAAKDRNVKLSLVGSDVDLKCVKDASINAKEAGVFDSITFKHKDVGDLSIQKEHGILMSNLPYGVKVGTTEEIRAIYKTLNDVFKDKPGWSLYLLTSDQDFPRSFHRAKPNRVRKLYNGNMETHYFQYFGEKPTQ